MTEQRESGECFGKYSIISLTSKLRTEHFIKCKSNLKRKTRVVLVCLVT